MAENNTDYAVPTGDFIVEWLEDNELSCAELARRTGYSKKQISLISRGLAPVTADFAARLELVTGIPATHWLALEAQYQSDVARLALEHEAAQRTDVLTAYGSAIRYLRKSGWVTGNMHRPGRLLMELMAFFGVASPDALLPKQLMPQASFLQSGAYEVHEASVVTWLHLAMMETPDGPPVAEFSREALEGALAEIRSLSRSVSTKPHAFVDVLASVGVRVAIQPEVPGCRAYGATLWDGGAPTIVLSARGKKDGALWFALFHEIGHVLLHPNQVTIEDNAPERRRGVREAEANNFASSTLVGPELRRQLASVQRNAEVEQLAEEHDVSPGVLVHYLHHEKIWEHPKGQKLYVSLRIEESDDA